MTKILSHPSLRSAVAVMLAVGALGVLTTADRQGLRVNISPSVPTGLYRTAPDRAPAVGDVVLLCPPDTPPFRLARARGYIAQGDCPGGYQRLFKFILAAKMDEVTIDNDGVTVNGRLLPHSAPLPEDRAGRPLRPSTLPTTVLGARDLLVMTDADPRSFDARYFGLLDIAQVEAVVTPLLTW